MNFRLLVYNYKASYLEDASDMWVLCTRYTYSGSSTYKFIIFAVQSLHTSIVLLIKLNIRQLDFERTPQGHPWGAILWGIWSEWWGDMTCPNKTYPSKWQTIALLEWVSYNCINVFSNLIYRACNLVLIAPLQNPSHGTPLSGNFFPPRIYLNSCNVSLCVQFLLFIISQQCTIRPTGPMVIYQYKSRYCSTIIHN